MDYVLIYNKDDYLLNEYADFFDVNGTELLQTYLFKVDSSSGKLVSCQ